MTYLTIIQSILESLVALGAIGGFLWGGWKMLIQPIKKIIKTQETLEKTINEKILPSIVSLEKELSKNGGKSIKDQINRIDDAVALAELRSKMIASNLITTGAYECDAEGRCTWVNKAYCEMFGLTNEEAKGNGWLASVDELERIEVWKKWLESIALDIPYETEYMVSNHTNNTKFRVRSVAVAHKSVDRKILGFYGTVIKLPSKS